MDRLATLWPELTIEQFIITLLCIVIIFLGRKLYALSEKYHLINENLLVQAHIVEFATNHKIIDQGPGNEWQTRNPLKGGRG